MRLLTYSYDKLPAFLDFDFGIVLDHEMYFFYRLVDDDNGGIVVVPAAAAAADMVHDHGSPVDVVANASASTSAVVVGK